jgi:cytoskeletal protein CcmA (bactofilin family)
MTFFSSRKQSEEELAPRPVLPTQPIGFETVIGMNCVLEGTLSSTGNVRIDGTFTGTLEISGNVLVGETAKITAHVDAKNISIAGAIRGNVTGNKVQLLRTGRIWGDINANALTTEEGAFIDGKITMKGHSANNPKPEPVASVISEPVALAPEPTFLNTDPTQPAPDNETAPTKPENGDTHD